MPGARDPLYQVSKLRTMGGELVASGRRGLSIPQMRKRFILVVEPKLS